MIIVAYSTSKLKQFNTQVVNRNKSNQIKQFMNCISFPPPPINPPHIELIVFDYICVSRILFPSVSSVEHEHPFSINKSIAFITWKFSFLVLLNKTQLDIYQSLSLMANKWFFGCKIYLKKITRNSINKMENLFGKKHFEWIDWLIEWQLINITNCFRCGCWWWSKWKKK